MKVNLKKPQPLKIRLPISKPGFPLKDKTHYDRKKKKQEIKKEIELEE